MADVKWIKIYTDMISNKKIKRIRKLPEGNNIVLIWVFLLAQAGESNKNGALYLTDTLPFRSEDLAIEFDFEVTVINLALITLERFSMIEVFDDIIYIKNWNEYQNIEGMDKIREQTRLRNVKYREKQKQLQLRDVSVTSHDETELDIEVDKDIKDLRPKRVYDEESLPYRTANYLYTNILKHKPDLKKPNLQTWANHMRMLIELDKRNPKEIGTVIEWATKDSFWQSIILSADNLRKKWDTVTVQMKKDGYKPTNKAQPDLRVVQVTEEQRKEQQDAIAKIRERNGIPSAVNS